MKMARLIDAVERRPGAAFAGFLVVHGLVWTALPSLIYFNLPLDVIEAMVYGREWQLGYDKLPPLPWWVAEAVYRVFGFDDSLYALSQIAVIIAFVAVWKTARPLVGATGALAAILITDGMHYFTASATKFNHNVIELPLWALAGFAFYAALRREKTRLLGPARGGDRARVVGQIFHGGAGGAVRAVSDLRPRCARATWPARARGSRQWWRLRSWRRI